MGNVKASGILNYQITNLPNYQIEENPSRERPPAIRVQREQRHEGSGISKKDL